MLRERSYLTEATFNLDRDVERIWNKWKGLKGFVDAYERNDIDGMKKWGDVLLMGLHRGYGLTSGDLKTRAGRKAHKANPIDIELFCKPQQMDVKAIGYYKPSSSKIVISPRLRIINRLRLADYDKEKLKRELGIKKTEVNIFDGTYREDRFKTLLHHELSHWVNDSLHNRHITDKTGKARAANSTAPMVGKHSFMYHTPVEIDAMVHEIKYLRKKFGKRKWDKTTWGDLFFNYRNLFPVVSPLDKAKDYDGIMRVLVKRLHREDLLGKAMKKIPSWREVNDKVSEIMGK